MPQDRVSPEWLRERVDYNPETGKFIWKARPSEDFVSEPIWKSWNTRYAGTPAFNIIKIKTRKSGSTSVGLMGRAFYQSYHAADVAWAMHYGEWPTLTVDHINGNPLDNRICNLRQVTRVENARNKATYRNNRSGVSGVYPRGNGRWYATIGTGNGNRWLGTFGSQKEAIDARMAAERLYGYHENHGRAGLVNVAHAQALLSRAIMVGK